MSGNRSKGDDDGWELALIGNNLDNKMICGNFAKGNYQNGLFFGGVRLPAETGLNRHDGGKHEGHHAYAA